MIRRFNYTKRRTVARNLVTVKLVPQATGPATFNATVRLDGTGLPADARLYLEAHYKSSYMRFPFGTVAAPRSPDDRALTDIDRGTTVLFRLKVVDESGTHGRILAELDDIVADESGGGDANRYCILPVRFTDLGQEIWRVTFASRPILEVNRFDGVEDLVRSDALFASLVFPAAVREILSHILVARADEAEADDGWPGMWIRFATVLHGEAPPVDDQEDADVDAKIAWIDDVVRAFCAAHRLRDRVVAEREEAGR